MVKFFMHSLSHETKVADVHDLHKSTISRHMHKWLPKWARHGEFLSKLHVLEDYFEKEAPDEFIEIREELSNTEADGKDEITDATRKKDAMKRRQYSSKVSTDTVR